MNYLAQILQMLLILALFIVGVYFGVAGFQNLFIFTTWVVLIASASIALTIDKTEKIKKPLPRLLRVLFFTIMVIALAWTGWFFHAGAWLLTALFIERIIYKVHYL